MSSWSNRNYTPTAQTRVLIRRSDWAGNQNLLVLQVKCNEEDFVTFLQTIPKGLRNQMAQLQSRAQLFVSIRQDRSEFDGYVGGSRRFIPQCDQIRDLLVFLQVTRSGMLTLQKPSVSNANSSYFSYVSLSRVWLDWQSQGFGGRLATISTNAADGPCIFADSRQRCYKSIIVHTPHRH